MESEKVKEIKRVLEEEPFNTIKHHKKEGGWIVLSFQKILTLINELESENERLNKSDTSKEESSIEYYNLYKDFKRENQTLKDRIAELEKEVETRKEEVLHLQEYGKKLIRETELKQFAERLKEKFYYVFGNEYEQSVSGFDTKVLIEYIDETLKEYEK